MTCPTFETRLVPISEVQHTFKDSDHVIGLCKDLFFKDVLQRCFFCEEYRGIKEHWVDDHGLYVEPTRFLQWRLKGTETWSHKFPTHEFKMGEE